MEFPVYLPIGPWKLHPHPVFEALAYFIGFRLYLWTRRKERLPTFQALWIIVAAALGAAIGSKLLYWLEDPVLTMNHAFDVVYLMEGKTIVGGLLGGLVAVELMKRKLGITQSTGDDMVFPLLVAIAIGRVGCFLTGLSDHTYGTATSLPWGVDFGDGVKRHPTQLYEIAFLVLLGGLLRYTQSRTGRKQPLPDGAGFQLFMAGYLLFRLTVDFIKPTPHPYLGLNNVQLACLAGLIYYGFLIIPWIRSRRRDKEMAYAGQS
ncbi:diacylglyceryl transferase [Cohnella sp. CFH 77786]|uniref:prolipoprotein diacylglyceryl transferase n=1 Tax=Cohnella sp. CFH 77786 TaxID=2662265 RepID=UPI001C60ECE3|nr:prolipoprotein diacylglyceryl transferase family protein [Cohnella sp. CFH 77786]MBW5448838.1 diacylglyceryl transferase [Cohnella sp. CFH 77786]